MRIHYWLATNLQCEICCTWLQSTNSSTRFSTIYFFYNLPSLELWCPQLSLFYKLTSNKLSTKFSPTSILGRRSKQDKEVGYTEMSSLQTEVQNYLSWPRDSPLPRRTEHRFVLSIDSPFFQALHPVHTSAFLITHIKSNPSLHRAFSQRALSNSAAAHSGGLHGKAGCLAKPQRRLLTTIKEFGPRMNEWWKSEIWKEQRHVMKKDESPERGRGLPPRTRLKGLYQTS